MSTTKRLALLLGAGFSKDAGLPLVADFTKDSGKERDGLEKHRANGPGNEDFRYAAQMLCKAADAYFDFQKRFRTQDLEEVYCIAEALREVGANDDVELIKQIRLWIWKVYQQFPIRNPLRQKETRKKTYEDFFARLEGFWDRTTVISMNYDLVFEHMAWESGVSCTYPLNIGKIKAGYGSEVYAHLGESNSKSRIKMCKPHGSVNFFEDMQSGQLFVANDVGDGQLIGNSPMIKDMPAIFALDAIYKIRCEHPNFSPAFVPPTYAKLAEKRWLKTMWRQAFEALKAADTLLIIGYSMPQTDGFIRALIHASLAEKRKDGFKVFAIDPDPKELLHERYNRLFGECFQMVKAPLADAVEKNGVIANEILPSVT